MNQIAQPRSTRLVRRFVENRTFQQQKLTVADVGARLGYESHWTHFGDQVRMIGFEPDPEECEKVNRELGGSGHRCYPVALHRSRARRTFYITSTPPSCGFYKPDQGFFSRIPNERSVQVLRTVEIETTDFDSFAREQGVGPVDFMKLDVEGAELDVLMGAEKSLSEDILGVSVEVAFYPFHEHRPVFRDLDAFLWSKGFALFDLECVRYARKILSPFLFHPAPGSTREGQVIWGQAIYFRDAAASLKASGKAPPEWPLVRVLKLAAVMEVFNFHDCAAELLDAARQCSIVTEAEAASYLDLLTPDGMTYQQFLKATAQRTQRRSFLKRLLPGPVLRATKRGLSACRNLLNNLLME
jgi:FkbM family methyltransferase